MDERTTRSGRFPRIMPDPADRRLTEAVAGIDQAGGKTEIRVPVERALTLYLNAQEIVTMMRSTTIPSTSRSATCSTRTC